MIPKIKVVPFLNPFVEPRRIEILIDWQKDWSAESLDDVTGFEFGVAETETGTPAKIAELTWADALTAKVPEISEQLFPLFRDVPDLAPNFVKEILSVVSKPDDDILSTPQDIPASPFVFLSPHPTADLARWYRGSVETSSSVMSAQQRSSNAVRSAIDAILGRPQQQAVVALDASDVPEEVRKPALLLKAVEAAEQQDADTLRDAMEAAAKQDQFTYAEALRREAIYRRVQTQHEPIISASGDDETKLAPQRADLRRIARDEPVIGAMFRALHWFQWPDALDVELKQGWFLFAKPITMSERFEAAPTLIGLDDTNRPVTVLRRDKDQKTYFAKSMHVRQISPALLIEEEAPPALAKVLETKHLLQPFAHEHDGSNPDMDVAFAANDAAHEPTDEQAGPVTNDAERELADGAESLRRHHPPFDAIGVTWERNAAVSALTDPKPQYHCGYKGYRIDVREKDGHWESLCVVERAVLGAQGEEIIRTRLPREGYVFQAVQNHSPADGPRNIFTMPSDFVHWAGGSIVVAAPLDRLGQALPRAAENDHPLIAFREAGNTRTYPRYGRTYEFRARGVGLTGVGPSVEEETSANAAVDEVVFLRGIPMSAPDAEVSYQDLVPIDPKGQPVALPDAKPDMPMKVAGSDPRMDVRALLPITHWRVALHARGLTREEREQRGGEAFENACARFVARSRDRWRRRAHENPNEQRNAAHLSAVDPHCNGVKLATKVWFPFSTHPQERYLTTGVTRASHRELEDASFSQLVVMGENIIEELDLRHDEFHVPVVSDLLPASDTKDHRARLLAGFHSLVEVSGAWSERAQKHEATKTRMWTRQLSMRKGPARPIGGRVESTHAELQAGPDQPLLVQSWLRAEASYAAMAKPEMERTLPEPDQKTTPAGTTCDIDKPAHVRAEVIRWRKTEFEKNCGEPPQDCTAGKDAYVKFVVAQLGRCIETPQHQRQPSQKHDLSFCLLPQLMQDPADLERSLVRPLFTFPGQTIYGDIIDTDPGDKGVLRSMPAKIGEFASFGIVRIDVQNGGTGYTTSPTVTITDGGVQKGAAATAELKDGKVDRIVITAPGDGFTKDVQVQITGGGGSGATATAVRKTSRRLPWIDDEITWVVRLAWRIPLANGPLERPLELSAVREFRLYRRDLRKPDMCETKTPDKPLAVLPRPGVDALQTIDLDRVEFAWVDAIADRDAHEFEYVVEAVPEDDITFEKQTWVRLNVGVPDSKIAARPESLRFLPMRSDHGTRRLGLYVSDQQIRSTTDHVTYFVPIAADDPLLPIHPKVKASGSPDLQPPTFADLFPPTRIPVTPVANFNELRARRPSEDGVAADAIGSCDENAMESKRAPMFVIANRDANGNPLIAANDVFGNPFFRLHVYAFDDDRFPALAHTAASDPAESDWLQFYPDALAWKNDGTVSIDGAWGDSAAVNDNLIWYRWHFFVPASDTMSFHLSTFYSRAPNFDPSAQSAAFRDAWTRFVSMSIPASIDVLVHAEEGMRAPTYSLDDNGVPVSQPLAQHEMVFQVIRSTADALLVKVAL